MTLQDKSAGNKLPITIEEAPTLASVDDDFEAVANTPISAEEIVSKLKCEVPDSPLCWLVCLDDLPLQGTPPWSSTTHLLIFSTKANAEVFINRRHILFGEENLWVVAVQGAEQLKQLATATGKDPCYNQPPFGLLLNFTYPIGSVDRIVSSHEVESLSDLELVQLSGLVSK